MFGIHGIGRYSFFNELISHELSIAHRYTLAYTSNNYTYL